MGAALTLFWQQHVHAQLSDVACTAPCSGSGLHCSNSNELWGLGCAGPQGSTAGRLTGFGTTLQAAQHPQLLG